MADEIELAKALAHDVVLAQGNVFIRELLRENGIRLGTTKADFARNLDEAINDKRLSLATLEAWVHSVEGWGFQYVYLWEPSDSLAGSAQWDDVSAVRSAAERTGFGAVWNAVTAQAFPQTMTLTRVSYENARLLFEWHEATSEWVRDPVQDYDAVIDDDNYKFHAFRERRERSVMRFEFRPRMRIAAAFVSVAATSEFHAQALATMRTTVEPLVPAVNLIPFNVGRAIPILDEAQLRPETDFRTFATRLSGQGAYVEFGSTVTGHGYREVDTIRDVRLAVRPGSVVGNTATILFNPQGRTGKEREVRVQFYGNDGRIWIRAQMNADQVWTLLSQVRSIGQGRG